jgi:AraC-like DNA-binding protein
VRISLAGRLLATDSLTVAQVAHRLGYAEAASFIHAYRRWHGTTPGRRAMP